MKSKTLNRICLFMFFIIVVFVLCPDNVYASQDMKELKYDIEVTSSGDMIITENWNINISDTNTLFKTFEKDGSYDEITDVSVTEVEDNSTKTFEKSDRYQYHVDKDYFQALTNEDGLFEIAWGVSQDSSETREFIIKYTVKGHVVKYNDCAEIYWKLIGDNFDVPIERITGTINLPEGIENLEDLRVWAHGPLNGTINKDSKTDVSFSVSNLPSNNFLEIRIATPVQIFENVMKKSNVDRLDTIISEETAWANEANIKREKMAKNQEMINKLILISGIIICAFLVYKAIKDIKLLRKTPKLEPTQKLDYFREIPDETASAAEVGFLYYFSNGGVSYRIGETISGTMLNLCLKGWISFEPEAENKKKVNVILNESGKVNLTEDEEYVYNFLTKIPKNDNKFSMKEFQKYCNNNYTKSRNLVTKIPKIAEKKAKEKELFDKKMRKQYNKLVTASAFYMMFAMFIIFIYFTNIKLMLLEEALILINLVITIILANRLNGLTQKGIDEKEKWKGLKKYMEDFSMLDEREVPDLVLWEKYLVFATVFGISDKVIKQLKIRYPELNDEQYLRSHYSYMYMISANNNFNFISSMSSSIGSVTNYSSGSGSGGGFSGGGGFGRRWRWRRRPLISIKTLKVLIKKDKNFVILIFFL